MFNDTFWYCGCGSISSAHASYNRKRKAKLVAACDIIEERRKNWLKNMGLKKYVDYKEMLKI